MAFSKEFWEKQNKLTEKLRSVNKNKFTNIDLNIPEKKEEPKKPYTNRRKNFNRGLQDRKKI